MLELNKIHCGDTRDLLKTLPDESINCCVTSPPYWGLRDYGTATWDGGDSNCEHSCGGQVQDNKAPGAISTGVRPGCDASVCSKCGAVRVDSQIGLEKTPEAYIQNMVEVFREVKRALRDDGTLWLNLGDSYATGTTASRKDGRLSLGEGTEKARKINRIGTPQGLKTKDLVGIPWRVALALQADGWYLRQDIIWAKPNPMPESVTDRCTKSHEYIFLLSKSAHYYYDHEAIKEPVAESTIGRGPVSFGGQKGRDYTPDPTDPNFRNGHEQWGRTFDYRKSCKSNGKHSTTDKNSSGRRMVENTKKARLNGGDHDSPFGFTRNKRTLWEIEDHNELLKWLNKDHPEIAGEYFRAKKKDVWTVTTKPFKKAHFATFPPKLITPCILAGCPKGGVVLDPFSGAGTTGFVAVENNRDHIGFELNPDYIEISDTRRKNAEPQLF